MALTYSTTDQFGNTYSAAYLKVLTVGIGTNNTRVVVGVLDNNGVSPLKQAYAWLKTQSDPIDLTSASNA